MQLLTVLPVSSNDHLRAEKLLDFIAAQRGKKPYGSVLIVGAPDLHEEARIKLRIAAEIGFRFVEVIGLPWPPKPIDAEAHPKHEIINYIFESAALHILNNYRSRWLWLEPDTTPVKSDWLERLQLVDDSQPKRFCGPFMGPVPALGRVSVYPQDVHRDFMAAKATMKAQAPFEYAIGDAMLKRSTKTRLIQYVKYDANFDDSKLFPEAVLIHGDKESVLLAKLIEASRVKIPVTSPFLNSPPSVETSARSGSTAPAVSSQQPEPVPAKVDRRTKEGRALAKQTEPVAA